MCQFVSWIEYEKKVYFLDDLKLNTKEGRELLKQCKDNDIRGHGAIRAYYPELGKLGTDVECEDFSSPDKFPSEVVEAIKKGIFTEFGKCLAILTEPAYAECGKVDDAAYVEYEKVDDAAWAEYMKVRNAAYAEYDAEYMKVRNAAYAEYDKVRGAACAEYDKVRNAACAEYEKKHREYFWSLARNKNNRVEAWK
jgi:hypothetical protein